MAARRDLFDPTDSTDLQPEQRQREVAAILAAGVIRMRERRWTTALDGPDADNFLWSGTGANVPWTPGFRP